MKHYRILFLRSAEKELFKLPEKYRERTFDAIERLSENPRPVGCAKLKGYQNRYRITIGKDYRIIYSIQDDLLLVEVIRIRHRKEVYR